MNTRRANFFLVFALVPLALAGGSWLRGSRPPESPLDRANRICLGCGVDVESVDRLIDTMAENTLTRDEQLILFRAQFEDASKAELGEPCATAILDAAHDPIERNPIGA